MNENLLINGSFEDGWTIDSFGNQTPTGLKLSRLENKQPMLSRGAFATDTDLCWRLWRYSGW